MEGEEDRNRQEDRQIDRQLNRPIEIFFDIKRQIIN